MTEPDVPAPLTPPDCDLRGLPFMPLDVVRLCDSDLAALATGDEFKAAVLLWAKSWVQIPAASLPEDPRILAHLSGAGSRWARVKGMALKGWVKCQDGRLYHPVVAEKAREAWEARTEHREMKENEAERQRRHRDERKRLFATLRERGLSPPWDTTMETLRSMVARAGGLSPATDLSRPVTRDRSSPVTEPVTLGHGTGNGPVTRTATAKTGTGTVEEESFALSSPSGDAPAPDGSGETAPPPLPTAAAVDDPVPLALAAWEAICVPAGLSRVAKATDPRRRAIAARLRAEFGGDLERWQAYLRRIAASSFLTGGGERGWKADLDWAVMPKNVVRVLEGFHDDRGRAAAAPKLLPALDERYWNRSPAEVRQLPKPRVGTPERLAWDEAQFGRSAPHPSTRRQAPIA
jgi:uncharacterized protein YdaU (DUF1376 family)